VRKEPDAALPSLTQWPLRHPRLLGRLPASARNINLFVEDSDGSRYVLRGCTRNPSRERIIFQLEFQDHLRCHGIPIPQVVTTEAGERCVESSPASLWVMFRFVEGHHYRYNSRLQLLRAARCLSGIHAAGASFATKPVQDDTIPDLLRWWTHGEEEIVALRRMFSGGGVEPELDFLDDWRSAATRDLPLRVVAGLPRSWLHSDFRPSNVLFAGDQVQAVLDFDVVHRGFRLEDIAYAMFCFCRQGRSSAVIDAEASAIFQQVFDLTGPERGALPYFIVAVQARTAARYRVRAREGTDPREALRTHIRRMRALSGAGYRRGSLPGTARCAQHEHDRVDPGWDQRVVIDRRRVHPDDIGQQPGG
jgi:Ser/Thr protein kinase RdoA (MazF antagonist)